MAEPTNPRTTRVVAVVPRSVIRVAVTTGIALAVSIAVATAGLVAVASVTGAHRPIDRMFSALQRGHHMNTSELIILVGAALAGLALVGTVLVGVLVAVFANHVLPLTGGVAVDEGDPTPRS